MNLNITPQAAKKKLLAAQQYPVRSNYLAKALADSHTSEIDTTAAFFGMTRAELLAFVLRWKTRFTYREQVLSFNCAMHGHAILRKAINELNRLGLKADYWLNLSCRNPILFEPCGTYEINLFDRRVAKLCENGYIPELPAELSTRDMTQLLDSRGESFVITYELPENPDETQIKEGLKFISCWTKDLREKDVEGFESVKKIINYFL